MNKHNSKSYVSLLILKSISVENYRVVTAMVILCLGLISFSKQLQATAIYDALATGSLSITNIVGGSADTLIEGEAFIASNFAEAIDNAEANTMGHAIDNIFPDSLVLGGIGSTLDLQSRSFGSGIDGEAVSFFFTEGTIEIDNIDSTVDVMISFEFEYTLRTFTSIDNPLLEHGFANTVISGFTTPLDLGFFDFFEELESDSDSGGAVVERSGRTAFDLVIPPGEVHNVRIFVDTSGETVAAPAPEPSSITLLGIGASVVLIGIRYKTKS